MQHYLMVGAGGFLGATCRYGITLLITKLGTAVFPWATLTANVVGCLLIGALMPMAGEKPLLEENGRLFFVVGILGGFTTFSAFGYETVLLLKRGSGVMAGTYVVCSVLAGLAAVWLGRLISAAVIK